MLHLFRTPVVIASFALAAHSAFAVVVWDESINGDLSNDRAAPTSLTFTAGTNSVIATSVSAGSGEREYFTFTLPAGYSLTSIVLASYSGLDGTAFIGVQQGTSMTVDPTSGSPAGLLGYTHFGTGPGNVGTNILDDIGLGAGATGFVGSLPAGSYTFWTQQAGASPSTYQLD